MEQNAISQLEKELVKILREEYTFYQSLYVLLDKQKDVIKYNKDENLLDIYAEVERCHKRIQQSEEKITFISNKNPKLFRLASISPNVRKLVKSITTLVNKCMNVVQDNEAYVNAKHTRIKEELGELKNSEKILNYISSESKSPQFIDGKG